jgi:hypothetical protein
MTDASAGRVKEAMEFAAHLKEGDFRFHHASPESAVLILAAEVTALAARLKEVEGEREAWKKYAHEATKTLTGLTPGGSEYFGTLFDGIYLADLSRCERVIRERYAHGHEARIALAALTKRDSGSTKGADE